MKYDSAKYEIRIQQLFERHQSVQSAGFTPDAYKPGLEAMLKLDSAMGKPSQAFRSVHVAGTNGKGTVCSMIAAGLASTGLKVGLYTSPHLLDFRERMKIVGPDGFSLITREEVWDFLEANSQHLEGRSFFEVTTAMAFSWFAAQQVDVAVIETGLGGRLDSTNIIIPELSVITSIGLDHCHILGDTRTKIAAEKAGIFKSGVPALVAEYDAETAPVFEQTAAAVHCPLIYADNCFEVEPRPDDPPIPGYSANLRTALAALDILGVDASGQAVRDYRRLTGLRGRWDKLCCNPEVIADIGHNPPALKLNFEALKKASEGRDLLVVYGIMADKDLDSIAPLLPQKATYFLVSPATTRALDAATLQQRLASLRPDLATTCCQSVPDGVLKALEASKSLSNPLVYIGGSTFVVSDALEYFETVQK